MRVTVLTVDNPWVTDHGGTVRTRAFVDAFARAGHIVSSVYLDASDSPTPGVPAGVEIRAVPAALASQRMPPIARRLKRWLLPMPTSAGARVPSLSGALRELPRQDLLVVQQMRTASYIDDLAGSALWLDQTDLISAFLGPEVAHRKWPASATARLQQRGAARAETEWARRASVVTAAGWDDAASLRASSGRPVTWLPTPVTIAAAPGTAPGHPPVAGLFANFEFWPNVDAYDRLRRRWAPPLVRLGWRVVVAGHGSLDLPPDDHIERWGPVATPADFYDRVDVALAPICLGAGIKVKVIEALRRGRPVIATPEALTGLPPDTRARILTADAEAPDFSVLAAGPPQVDPAILPLLDTFTHDHFRAVVGELLESVGSRVTG